MFYFNINKIELGESVKNNILASFYDGRFGSCYTGCISGSLVIIFKIQTQVENKIISSNIIESALLSCVSLEYL